MRLTALLLLAASAALAAPTPNADLATAVDGSYDVTFALRTRGPQQTLLLDWDKGTGLVLSFGDRHTVLAELTPRGARTLSETLPLSPCAVRVKRRFPLIEVYGGQGLLLRAYSRRPLSGSSGPASGADLANLSVQPVDLIAFHDEFFNPEGGESVWEPQTGKWSIGTYRDPLKALENRPIAASWYQCQADGAAISLTGQDFWDSYRVRAAVQASATVASGLVLYANGKAGGYVFRVRPQAEGQGVAELLLHERVLRSVPVAWREGNWYELAAEPCGDELTCFVQGQQVASVWQRTLAGGRAGLYVSGKGEARFDDFAVTSVQRAHDGVDWTRDCWQRLSGSWGNGKFDGAIAHVSDFSPSTASAIVRPTSGSLGLLLNWSGNEGYRLDLSAKAEMRLSRVDSGKPTVLASAKIPRAGCYGVRLSHHDGRLEAQAGGVTRVVYDFSYQAGRAGCAGSGTGEYSSFATSDEASPNTQISAVNGVRTPMPGENSDSRRFVLGFIWQPVGGNWSGVSAKETTRLSGRPYAQAQPTGLWYYQPCPGDAAMAVEELQLNPGGTAGLALACDRRDVLGGYRAEVDAKTFKLYRADKLMASSPLSAPPAALRLWRDGQHVAATVGKQGIAFEDKEPLPGALCASYAVGTGMSAQQVTLSHRRGSYYAFKSEETDWQPAQGEWMTHSGMACIPWDYWYTGKGAPQSLAWHAQPQLANLHVDFWVGEYTEGYADGEHKHFPYHDISLITSAAKPELDGGYRILIGAEGGTVTRLLRLGKVVAETRDPACRITMGGHCNEPRELHVVLHQVAGRLTLTVDDRQVLDYTDPQPLGSGILGLGTTGCNANFRDLWLAEMP